MTTVSDLFDIQQGNGFELNGLGQVEEATGVAFVSRTSKNNGVSAWVGPVEDVVPHQAGLLTVALGGTVLETFLQEQPFYTGYHISILAPKKPMSRKEKLWWATAIRANAWRYNYGRQANRTLKHLELPDAPPEYVSTVDIPDYANVSNSKANATSLLGTLETWTRVPLGELFTLRRGKCGASPDANGGLGRTPLVSATKYNNGVSTWVANEATELAGGLTVAMNGSVGEIFYQNQDYLATTDVACLTPRPFVPINTGRGLFIAALFRREQYRYNYGRKLKQDTLLATELPLPATASGGIDWAGIDLFVAGLNYSSSI